MMVWGWGSATGIWWAGDRGTSCPTVCKTVCNTKNGPAHTSSPHLPVCWKDIHVGESAVYDYPSLKPSCVFHIHTEIFCFWHGFNLQRLFQENGKLIRKCNLRENFTLLYLESKVTYPLVKSCCRWSPADGALVTQSPSLPTCICYSHLHADHIHSSRRRATSQPSDGAVPEHL